jgi:tetratricopeptide (TPR) repeat protein
MTTHDLTQARAAVASGQYEQAFQIYAELLRNSPNDAQLLREYGKARYCQYVDLDEATQLFERALQAEPTSVDTHLWLGDLYALGYGRGYAAALEHYRRALELDPNNVDAQLGIGMLHRAPGTPVSREQAVAAFRAAAAAAPDRADVHQDLAMALLQQADPAGARAELARAEQLLRSGGKLRQADGLQAIIQKLERGERVQSFSYTNASPRYQCK